MLFFKEEDRSFIIAYQELKKYLEFTKFKFFLLYLMGEIIFDNLRIAEQYSYQIQGLSI